MEKKPYHHLPDGTFRNPEGSPISRSSSGKFSYGDFNKEKGESKPSCDPISLSAVLNVMDGIRENHGRIMVFTSNHYNKLDPALTRSGRIDIELEMGLSDVGVINQIFNHNYGRCLSNKERDKFPENILIPPCDIVAELKYGVKPAKFISNLLRRSNDSSYNDKG